MKTSLVILFYNLLLPFALLLALPGYILKMRRRGGYGGRFFQRFAVYGADLKRSLAAGPRPFWLHAVSVGEVGVAEKLIAEIRRREPERPLVLTTTTSTGFAIADRLADADPHLTALYSPLDLPPVAWRARRVIRPERLILVEAEIWPKLVRGCQRRAIPATLVNARLSPRSESRYRKFAWIVRPIFGMLDSVCVQEPEDQERWSALGVDPGNIHLTGSIKFDQTNVAEPVGQVSEFRDLLRVIGVAENRPILLAASTHPGEEALIANAYLALSKEHPDLFYVAVPRHFERAPEAVADLEHAGVRTFLRSKLTRGEGLQPSGESPDPMPDGDPALSPDDPACLVVDTTGELRAWQFLADFVVIGKSFLATGGQNPAEAVAAGRPVIFGPHMENFSALVALLLKRGGGIQVGSDPESLTGALFDLIRDPQKAAALASSGRSALDAHRGATARTADQLLGSDPAKKTT